MRFIYANSKHPPLLKLRRTGKTAMNMIKKDFNTWCKQKEKIHNFGENKFYHPRDVWWCNLGVNIGFEQDGTGKENERPVLIVRGFNKEICLAIPLSTSKKENNYYIRIGKIKNREASVIISQIRLIDTKRLTNKIGILNKEKFEEIRKAVKNLI